MATLVSLSFLLAGAVLAEENEEKWLSHETRHTILHYKSAEDLKRFNHNIDFSGGDDGFFVFRFSRDEKDTLEKTGDKVDAIFERAQEILDMRKNMQKVVVNIYHDSGALDTAFFQVYRQPCRIRAWYRYWNNTIYINSRDIHAGMLAHELAHAIIDHYMVVRPPRATAEILARYVDEHLER